MRACVRACGFNAADGTQSAIGKGALLYQSKETVQGEVFALRLSFCFLECRWDTYLYNTHLHLKEGKSQAKGSRRKRLVEFRSLVTVRSFNCLWTLQTPCTQEKEIPGLRYCSFSFLLFPFKLTSPVILNKYSVQMYNIIMYNIIKNPANLKLLN